MDVTTTSSTNSNSARSPIPNNMKSFTCKSAKWVFQTDYNDHFETPLIAYEDIIPVLNQLSREIGKVNKDLIIYDPYFCLGRMKALLQSLGYENVINENEDFYRNIQLRKVPVYDILITNPPFSGEHKIKLLNFLKNSNKPSAILWPAYCSTKSYWKDFLLIHEDVKDIEKKRPRLDNTLDNNQTTKEVVYLLPPNNYSYEHPEGTGKNKPPFYSSWSLFGFDNMKLIENALIDDAKIKAKKGGRICVILRNVQDLVSRGYVTEKRPNPRMRKKMKSIASQKLHT